jgi:class I fructose-bisphosphate aldolase
VEQAYDMGAAAVGPPSTSDRKKAAARSNVEVSEAFALAHEMELATVLWCYLRNSAFKKDKDYHVARI